MKITGIDCHVLLVPDMDVAATSSAQDDIVVEIHTDEGVTGIGESDVNPWIARAAIEAPGTHSMGRGLKDMLIGEDPLDIAGIWERLYVGSAMNGRRGAVVHAIGAIDIALHDLRGKWFGKPCYALFGDRPAPRAITPYASLQPEVSSIEAYGDSMVRWALDAQRRGFKAAKLEATFSGPYKHQGLSAPYDRVTAVIQSVRAAVGPDFVLMVDVQYAFPDADTCLGVIRDWRDFNIFFLETPLPSDDLEGYARLAREAAIPIAAGEWLSTRFEFRHLIDEGMIAVAQPDVGRVGGLTEALRVCDMAGRAGRRIVPHAWKTGISIAAAAHMAAVTPHCPYIEFLPAELCESALRRELTPDPFTLQDGEIVLPDRPGLGVELNRDALERFRVS